MKGCEKPAFFALPGNSPHLAKLETRYGYQQRFARNPRVSPVQGHGRTQSRPERLEVRPVPSRVPDSRRHPGDAGGRGENRRIGRGQRLGMFVAGQPDCHPPATEPGRLRPHHTRARHSQTLPPRPPPGHLRGESLPGNLRRQPRSGRNPPSRTGVVARLPSATLPQPPRRHAQRLDDGTLRRPLPRRLRPLPPAVRLQRANPARPGNPARGPHRTHRRTSGQRDLLPGRPRWRNPAGEAGTGRGCPAHPRGRIRRHPRRRRDTRKNLGRRPLPRHRRAPRPIRPLARLHRRWARRPRSIPPIPHPPVLALRDQTAARLRGALRGQRFRSRPHGRRLRTALRRHLRPKRPGHLGTVAHPGRGSRRGRRRLWRDCGSHRRSGARRAPAPAGAGMNQLLRLMSYGRKYWPQILISVVLMALAGAAQGTMPLLIQPVFDRVLVPNAPDDPIPLLPRPFFGHRIYLHRIIPFQGSAWTMIASALLFAFFIKGVCDYLGNYLVSCAGFASVTKLRNAVFDKVLKQGAEFFEAHSTGQLMSAIMNDVDKVQVATSQILADLLRQFFVAVFLLYGILS